MKLTRKGTCDACFMKKHDGMCWILVAFTKYPPLKKKPRFLNKELFFLVMFSVQSQLYIGSGSPPWKHQMMGRIEDGEKLFTSLQTLKMCRENGALNASLRRVAHRSTVFKTRTSNAE